MKKNQTIKAHYNGEKILIHIELTKNDMKIMLIEDMNGEELDIIVSKEDVYYHMNNVDAVEDKLQPIAELSNQEESSISIEIGTLLSNKKGEMFIVQEVKNYSYKSEQRQKVVYYPISDNGLITKTKAFTCKVDQVEKKFNVLDWKF